MSARARSPARVGEHFMLGFRGVELPAWIRGFEERFGLGGVILFDRDLRQPDVPRNIESPAQVAALCAEVHALRSRPLVFIDQEGGRVRRLKPERGFAELPSAAAFARLDPGEAAHVARTSFAEMKRLGIDVDLAPVIDLNINPDNPNIGALERSFSAQPSEVRRCAEIFGEAARQVGLGLCLKHYPGLGAATTDSHEAWTDLSGSISPAQLELFDALVGSIPGGAILLSHGLVAEWDSEWPVSVSPAAIGRLRAAHPEALLITDDLQMGGMQHACSTAEAALRALRAGADLLCIGNNLLAEDAPCAEIAGSVAAAAAEQTALNDHLARSRQRIAARKQSPDALWNPRG